MKRALWLCLCGLLCACAHADTAATSAAEKESSALNLRKEPDQNPRSLRLDDGVKAPQQLKQQPGDDDGEEKDKLPGGAVGNKNQPVVIDAVETPLEKSASRPIHRVYDPVSGLFCELVGDCHACPVSEKDEVYCRETGNRQEMRCPRAPENKTPGDDATSLTEIRFQACVPIEEANPFLSVLLFEFVMASSLAGAFLLLRKEQQKHMSSFDLRKDPRQRGALLGSGGSQKGAD
ncbi:hypothetical protein Gpo141_00009053 [Globisporangium polare]